MEKLLKKIKIYFQKKPISKKKGFNPHKYWKILLTTFFSIIGLLILFSFYLFYQIKNDKIFQVETNEAKNEILLNEKLINKIEKDFEFKREKIEEIEKNKVFLKDPSL